MASPFLLTRYPSPFKVPVISIYPKENKMNRQADSGAYRGKKIRAVWLLVICLNLVPALAFALPAFLDRRPEKEQTQSILENSAKVLVRLYEAHPDARKTVEEAYGYATFSNIGVKIFFAGSGSGRGVAVNNQTQEKTFMNMAEVQAGLGLGVKKFMLVWVFDNEKTFKIKSRSRCDSVLS
jgi:hypothetical protein